MKDSRQSSKHRMTLVVYHQQIAAGNLSSRRYILAMAAIKPHPAFLPVLRMLNGVIKFDETRGLLVTEHWCDRNRRATGLRSPLAFVPESILIPTEIDGVPVYIHEHIAEVQRRPGPSHPQWKIPPSEWPDVLRRIEQGESLRQIASHYGVSYEAVRRVVLAAKKEEKML